jgi:hypothetical protein
MAFKMNPGRGSFAKTGRSIPTPFKQVDKEVDAMIAKKKARTENEMKAKADSTGVDKRLRDAGMPISAGEYGNKKANETRASLKGQFTYSMDKDKATGKYKKNYSNSPAKQVDKEVDVLIAKKKERDAKAKLEKARKEGEEGMAADNRKIRIKLNDINEYKAKSDSTAVDKKLRDAGMPYNAGVMGNKKANETRKEGSPYKGVYKSVDLDASTGKYKRTTKLSPAKMKKSPMKQGLNFSTKEDMAKSGMKPYKGSDRQKANEKGNAKANEARKTSPAKQCFPTPQEKADSAKKKFENRKNNPSDAMGKGPSKDAMKERGSKYEPGSAKGKVYKDSPAKQLGRQAVTKMGGKKTPAKMKKC